MKVLVIDDSFLICSIVQNALTQEGIDTIKATSGTKAIELARSIIPDLILLDMVLPDIDGLEVCKILKSDSQLAKIPVVFITASRKTENIVKGFELGAVDYIIKPFSTVELLARVHSHIRNKQNTEQLQLINDQLITANVLLAEALEKNRIMANQDSLTGLYNRRYLINCLDAWYGNKKIISQAPPPLLPRDIIHLPNIAIMIADIDNFKKINDTYGHCTGDYVICTISDIIVEQVGEHGIVGRMGGEEFIIVLLSDDFSNMLTIGKAICNKISEYDFCYENTHFNLSVTLGGAKVNPALSIVKNIEAGDRALYKGKRQGKNRLVIDEESFSL